MLVDNELVAEAYKRKYRQAGIASILFFGINGVLVSLLGAFRLNDLKLIGVGLILLGVGLLCGTRTLQGARAGAGTGTFLSLGLIMLQIYVAGSVGRSLGSGSAFLFIVLFFCGRAYIAKAPKPVEPVDVALMSNQLDGADPDLAADVLSMNPYGFSQPTSKETKRSLLPTVAYVAGALLLLGGFALYRLG